MHLDENSSNSMLNLEIDNVMHFAILIDVAPWMQGQHLPCSAQLNRHACKHSTNPFLEDARSFRTCVCLHWKRIRSSWISGLYAAKRCASACRRSCGSSAMRLKNEFGSLAVLLFEDFEGNLY